MTDSCAPFYYLDRQFFLLVYLNCAQYNIFITETIRCKMQEIIIATLIYLILLSTKIVSITVYNNAQFIPIDTRYMISTLSSISLDNRCLCACYNITICFTAMYSSTNQTCVLFSAHSSQGQLQILPTIWHSKVYSFNSRNSNSK